MARARTKARRKKRTPTAVNTGGCTCTRCACPLDGRNWFNNASGVCTFCAHGYHHQEARKGKGETS